MIRRTATAKTGGSRELPEGHDGAAYHYLRAVVVDVSEDKDERQGEGEGGGEG